MNKILDLLKSLGSWVLPNGMDKRKIRNKIKKRNRLKENIDLVTNLKFYEKLIEDVEKGENSKSEKTGK